MLSLLFLAHNVPKYKRKMETEQSMPPHPTETAPLSAHWAFVVHFRTDTDITQGRITGRVEHVVSGQSTHFDSLEELLAFVARVLASVRAPPRRRPSSGS